MRPRSLDEAVAIIERLLTVIADQQDRITTLETRVAEQRAEITALRAQITVLTEVDPTNNAAERALRPAVLWRKGCWGTHSPAGSRFVERILTVATTLKQQRRNVVDYVTQACVATLHGDAAPSLLPDSAHSRRLQPAKA